MMRAITERVWARAVTAAALAATPSPARRARLLAIGVSALTLSGWPAFSQSTIPLGINDRGEIVGFAVNRQGNATSFIYDKGVFSTLQFPGAADTTPRAIDNAGEIVGD
jgi:hypothetical protein